MWLHLWKVQLKGDNAKRSLRTCLLHTKHSCLFLMWSFSCTTHCVIKREHTKQRMAEQDPLTEGCRKNTNDSICYYTYFHREKSKPARPRNNVKNYIAPTNYLITIISPSDILFAMFSSNSFKYSSLFVHYEQSHAIQ